MGSNQSTPSANLTAHEKTALERLRTLQLENKEGLENEYVCIDNEKVTGNSYDVLRSREPETVPVTRMAEWQDALLRDPKNR
jgi:bleomycin hydrolase